MENKIFLIMIIAIISMGSVNALTWYIPDSDLNVNSSINWNNMNSTNSTQFDNIDKSLNIKESWLDFFVKLISYTKAQSEANYSSIKLYGDDNLTKLVNGTFNFTGNLTTKSITPDTNSTWDLGSVLYQFRNLWAKFAQFVTLKVTGDTNLKNLTVEMINSTGNVTIISEKGASVLLNNHVVHNQELMTDTLLDKSFSRLSVVDGYVNYTLVAIYGCGQFDFNGTIYPKDHSCVQNATITLVNGTDINPVFNYIYWELVNDVPTLKVLSTEPTTDHIDVANFMIGNTSGTGANIYSYSRSRYEVDTFVKRVTERFQRTGTLYEDGFNPAVNTTTINITAGGKFINGIFEMNSTNEVNSFRDGFYYINGSGQFKQAKDLSVFIAYADGLPFSGGVNERINLVWGLVPMNVTGGVGPTQMRLVAVLPNDPAIKYNTVNEAIADIYGTTNYFPPNAEIKNVFVPIVRTIMKPSADVFEPFSTGIYYQDIRGRITVGGGSATSTDTSTLLPLDGSRNMSGSLYSQNVTPVTNITYSVGTRVYQFLNGFFANVFSVNIKNTGDANLNNLTVGYVNITGGINITSNSIKLENDSVITRSGTNTQIGINSAGTVVEKL